MSKHQISVVVCVENEAKRIKSCLESISQNKPSEIIIVDGDSQDDTVQIARKYTKKIIVCKNSNMVKDRQAGIKAAKNSFIVMVDADHRLKPKDLKSLADELEKYGWDAIQPQLKSYKKGTFWNQAEEEIWDLNHNKLGERNMLGTPIMFRKKVFKYVSYDPHITQTTEDTDLSYQLSKVPGLKMGVGNTVVYQEHFGTLNDYLRKYLWYGKGDGEFCHKNPERAMSMLFHLAIRYPLIYPLKALTHWKLKAIPLMALQGLTRLSGLSQYLIMQLVHR